MTEREKKIEDFMESLFTSTNKELIDKIKFLKQRVGYKTHIENKLLEGYENGKKNVEVFFSTVEKLDTNDKTYMLLLGILVRTIVFDEKIGTKEVFDIIDKLPLATATLKKS